MDDEQAWRVIERERLSLADLLDSLTDEEWERPSLCPEWRIRDVAAHVALVPHPPTAWSMVVDAVRARGNFHRLNTDVTRRNAQHPTAELVADLRDYAASRDLPVVTNWRNILFDIMVHGQDIAIPLGRERQMPLDAAAAGATRAWTMGWPFWAKRKLKGFRLVATDVDWTAGKGAEIRGPIQAILLLLTGRPVALRWLSGEGVASLAGRFESRLGTLG